MTEHRRQRRTLGCSLVLCSPLLLFGAVLLASASNDSGTGVETAWALVLLAGALIMCAAGVTLWLRHR
jgi:hypothetical protein